MNKSLATGYTILDLAITFRRAQKAAQATPPPSPLWDTANTTFTAFLAALDTRQEIHSPLPYAPVVPPKAVPTSIPVIASGTYLVHLAILYRRADLLAQSADPPDRAAARAAADTAFQTFITALDTRPEVK